MLDSSFKSLLHQHCIELVQQDVLKLQNAISGQKEGSEGSSSAGDKHNTEQAMQHLELEKKHSQLAVKIQSLKLLQQINPEQKCQEVQLGACISTNKGTFYFAAPLGKISVDEQDIMVLSLGSPLGRILSKMKKKETTTFNGEQWTIEELI